jgi:pre-rRNA-processing protein TSR1
MPEHHHRSTLKQQNKSFKGSSSSKRAIKRINKGKVPGAVSGPVASGGDALARKSQRANAAKQARDAKRQELLKQKRGIGSSFAGPRVVAIANVTKAGNVAQAKAKVLDGARIVAGSGSTSEEGPVTAEISGGGKVTVVETGREMVGFLDCMTVADILVLVVTAGDEVMDGLGQHLVLTARNFALPSAICVIVQGLEVRDLPRTISQWNDARFEPCAKHHHQSQHNDHHHLSQQRQKQQQQQQQQQQ